MTFQPAMFVCNGSRCTLVSSQGYSFTGLLWALQNHITSYKTQFGVYLQLSTNIWIVFRKNRYSTYTLGYQTHLSFHKAPIWWQSCPCRRWQRGISPTTIRSIFNGLQGQLHEDENRQLTNKRRHTYSTLKAQRSKQHTLENAKISLKDTKGTIVQNHECIQTFLQIVE